MLRFAGNPSIGIEQIDPNLTGADLYLAGQQCSGFMRWVQLEFNSDELGLKRIDTDPIPDPGDPEDVRWRMSRIQASGPVEETRLEYFRAIRLDAKGQPKKEVDAMLGMLVLGKKQGLCSPARHRSTEILEFDVVKGLRGQGVGTALLRFGMQNIHPEDPVVLDVARPNESAQAWYLAHTFKRAGGKPRRHGVFDVEHIGMRTRAATLQQHFGITSITAAR